MSRESSSPKQNHPIDDSRQLVPTFATARAHLSQPRARSNHRKSATVACSEDFRATRDFVTLIINADSSRESIRGFRAPWKGVSVSIARHPTPGFANDAITARRLVMSNPNSRQRPRLGRGLSSLLGSLDSPASPTGTSIDDAPIAETHARHLPSLPVERSIEPMSDTPLEPSISTDLPIPDLNLDPIADPIPAAPIDTQAIIPVNNASTPPVPDPDGTPLEIPLDAVTPNPHQPRRSFDEAQLNELASSIREQGVLQPVLVKRIGPQSYQLIAGERRLRAARLAGLATIPAIVKHVDELTQAQIALVENVQREDLNPVDRAAGYKTLMRELGMTQAELAQRLGEDPSTISNLIRTLSLPDDVLELMRSGKVTLGHAKILCSIQNDPAEQSRLAQLVVSQGLSLRNLERIIANPAPTTPTRASPTPASPHLREVEKSITQQLGLRVQLRSGSSQAKGKLIIHYTNLDEFDSLVERLGVQLDD
jgi:ParB family chromosome partitioning protein